MLYPNIGFTLEEYIGFIESKSFFEVCGRSIIYRSNSIFYHKLDSISTKLISYIYISKVDGLWQIFISTKTILGRRFKIENGDANLVVVINKLRNIFPDDSTSVFIKNFENKYIKDALSKKILETENNISDDVENLTAIFKDLGAYKSHSIGYLPIKFPYDERFHIVVNSCSNKYSGYIGFMINLNFAKGSDYLEDDVSNEVKHLEENLKILYSDYTFTITKNYGIFSILVFKRHKQPINLFD